MANDAENIRERERVVETITTLFVATDHKDVRRFLRRGDGDDQRIERRR